MLNDVNCTSSILIHDKIIIYFGSYWETMTLHTACPRKSRLNKFCALL